MVRAAVHRLRLTQRELDVVLGGGIVRSDCKLFHERGAGGHRRAAPHAHVVIMDAPARGRRRAAGARSDRRSQPRAASAATGRVRKMLTADRLT